MIFPVVTNKNGGTRLKRHLVLLIAGQRQNVVLEEEDYNLLEDSLEDEIIRVKIGRKGTLSTCHRNARAIKERNCYDEFRELLGDEAAAEIVHRYN